MAGQRKNIVILLLLLTLIYCQQSAVSYAVDSGGAAGGSGQASDSGQTEDTGSGSEGSGEGDGEDSGGEGSGEGGGNEGGSGGEGGEESGGEGSGEGDGEDSGETGGDEDDKEEETPPEPIKKYKLTSTKPDGQEDYYVTHPVVKLEHVSGRGITCYKLKCGKKVKAEGKLDDTGKKTKNLKEEFGEGKNVLTVWMEDEEGKRVDEMDTTKEFYVDTKPPEFQFAAADGFDHWYQKEAWVEVSGNDGSAGSGIASISCYCGNEVVGSTEDSQTEFLIQKFSNDGQAVDVTVTVEDRAGNKSEMTKSLYIDGTAPQISFGKLADYMITAKPVKFNGAVIEENILKSCKAEIERTDTAGEKTMLSSVQWKEGRQGREVSAELSQDGIYQIRIWGEDAAGHETSGKIQVIIDSTDPMIRYVDGLHGKYMKQFSWDYEREEIVEDFTTCVSSIRLDGKGYIPGKTVTDEGVHVLKAEAVDAAGNQAEASARFVIDHTPPEILFENVEEAGRYEKERDVIITLKDDEDEVQSVFVNGIKQELGSKNTFRQVFSEEGEYELRVHAVDKAGNTADRSVLFEIIPEETLLQKAVKPIKKLLAFDKDEEMEDGGQKNEKKEGRSKKTKAALPAALASGAGCLAGLLGWRRYKREDAG